MPLLMNCVTANLDGTHTSSCRSPYPVAEHTKACKHPHITFVILRATRASSMALIRETQDSGKRSDSYMARPMPHYKGLLWCHRAQLCDLGVKVPGSKLSQQEGMARPDRLLPQACHILNQTLAHLLLILYSSFPESIGFCYMQESHLAPTKCTISMPHIWPPHGRHRPMHRMNGNMRPGRRVTNHHVPAAPPHRQLLLRNMTSKSGVFLPSGLAVDVSRHLRQNPATFLKHFLQLLSQSLQISVT